MLPEQTRRSHHQRTPGCPLHGRAEELLVSGSDDSVGKRRAIGINDITFSAFLSSMAIDPKRAPRELPMVHPIEGSDLLYEAISTQAFSSTTA